MFRSIAHNKDFEVLLAYETEDLLPPGVLSQTFAHYVVSGLTDASAKYELPICRIIQKFKFSLLKFKRFKMFLQLYIDCNLPPICQGIQHEIYLHL